MTSTARLEQPTRRDSPMEVDRQAYQDNRVSTRASTASSSLSPPPEHLDPDEAAHQRAMGEATHQRSMGEVAHQRAMSMAKNRAASEDNANAGMNEFPLKISTTNQPRGIVLDETRTCTCTPTANGPHVPRPPNCKLASSSP